MDYRLTSIIPRGKPSKQLVFKTESKQFEDNEARKLGKKPAKKGAILEEVSGGILPINLSTSSIAVSSNTTQTESPKTTKPVTDKNYEPVGDWYLTGTLESNARCGEFVRALGCEDFGKDQQKHTRIIETYSCHRLGCPTCYESAAYREANKANERLLEGQMLYRQAGKKFALKHVVFSPDPSEHKHIKQMIEQGHYNVFKAKALAVIKKAGGIGGCITPHFWRQVGEKEQLPDNISIPAGLKDGDWYFSPHFHTMLAGYLEPSAKFHNETGWVYKNLGKRKSIMNTIFYFLTHCANHKNHHAVSWFGIYSYNKLVIDFVEKQMVTVPCQACNKTLHEYGSDYSWEEFNKIVPNWEDDKGVHFRLLIKRHFKIKGQENKHNPAPISPKIPVYFDISTDHEMLSYCNEEL